MCVCVYIPQTVLALGVLTRAVTNWPPVPPPGRCQGTPIGTPMVFQHFQQNLENNTAFSMFFCSDTFTG